MSPGAIFCSNAMASPEPGILSSGPAKGLIGITLEPGAGPVGLMFAPEALACVPFPTFSDCCHSNDYFNRYLIWWQRKKDLILRMSLKNKTLVRPVLCINQHFFGGIQFGLSRFKSA